METIFGVFGKQPIPGKVKTRLAAGIGPAAAAGLYAAFLTDLVDRFQSVGRRRVLGFTPASTAGSRYFHDLAACRYELWEQPDASLGDRIQSFFDAMFLSANSSGSTPCRIVLIGSDSPTVTRALIEEAFAALETKDCVLGPATDGGVYLIGLRRRSARLFESVDWGESCVLDQMIRNALAHDFSLHLLAPWYDVDTRDDLRMLRSHLAALRAAGQSDVAPHTADALERLCTARRGTAMNREEAAMTTTYPAFEIADFSEIDGVPCPCGTARRAFAEVEDFPGTVHVTEISADARLHYHKALTETYYFLECVPGAKMQLDDEIIPVRPGTCIMIRPGTRHRALGRAKVLILVLPKFDPQDEWFD